MTTYISVKNRASGTSTPQVKKSKAALVLEVQELLPQSVSGLEKLTIKSLNELLAALMECI